MRRATRAWFQGGLAAKGWMCLGLGLGVLVVSLACEGNEVVPPVTVCNPVLDSLEPVEGPVEGGTDVVLRGLFVATEFGERDVRVHVGGQEALVTGVFRGDGCSSCDDCAVTATWCGECDRVCRGELGWVDTVTEEWMPPEACEQWVSFATPPSQQTGEAGLQLTNSHGSASGLSFLYIVPGIGDDDDSAGDDDDSAGDDDDSAGR